MQLNFRQICRQAGLLLLLLCVSIYSTYGQSIEKICERSDSLFAVGVEIYKAKQYKDAIPLFTECKRLDSLIHKPNSSRLGYASMWLASCHYKLGNIEAASSLSDYYMVAPIDRRLTVKSDSISDIIYTLLYEKGDAVSAVPLIRKVIYLEEIELGKKNVWLGNTYCLYGEALLGTGQTEEGLKAYKQGISITEDLCGKKSKNYVYALSNMVFSCYSSNISIDSTFSSAQEIVDIFSASTLSSVGDSSIYYIANSICADFYIKQGNFKEAIPYLSESLVIITNSSFGNELVRAVQLLKLGRAELLTGKVRNAKALLEESYTLFKNATSTYDRRYAIECLNNLSGANFLTGDTIASINNSKEGISIFENENIDKNYLYPELHYNLWNIYHALKEQQKAETYAEKAIRYYRLLNCRDWNYANLLIHTAAISSGKGDYKRAINLSSEVYTFVEHNHNIPDSAKIMAQANLAKAYFDNGDMDSAYFHAQKNLPIIESKFSINSLNYIQVIKTLLPILIFNGHREECLLYYQKVLSIIEEKYANTELHYEVLSDYAAWLQLLGNFTQSLDCQKDVVKMAETLYGKNSDKHSDSVIKLLQYLDKIGDEVDKESIFSQVGLEDKAKLISKEQYIKQQAIFAANKGDLVGAETILTNACNEMLDNSKGMSVELANLLMLLAEVQIASGKFQESLLSLTTVNIIFMTKFGEGKFEHQNAYYWKLKGIALLNLQRYDEAETAISNSISIYKSVLGDNNLETLSLEVIYVMMQVAMGKIEESSGLISQLFRKTRDQIFTHFSTMSSSERMSLWSQTSYIFNPLMPFLAVYSKTKEFNQDGYNAILLTKGLLLNTEREVSQILKESDNQAAVELYENLLQIRQKLNSLQVNGSLSAVAEADSLRESIKDGERQLMTMSSDFGDYTRNLRITWEDVQSNLRDSDVAIEFTDFYNADDSANIYVAFVLKKDMKEPQIVRLFDSADFNNLTSLGVYVNDSLYNLVWKPLEPFFFNSSRIYFSPSGVLHGIAIESIPTSDGSLISEHYDIYRLSSTRELCLNYTSKSEMSAVLYGGIDYDVSVTPGSNLTLKEKINDTQVKINRNNNYFNNYREAIEDELLPLPGTAAEVDSIAHSFTTFNHPVKMQKDKFATEESIKSLSLDSITILHIATHGYYLSPVTSGGLLSSLLTTGTLFKEDKTLMRSGLFFAGANATIGGEQLNSKEDGILTANEVAYLDLQSCNLVSLSACQTGLGEISGDGVFGLQRGFKKAGANSILMSLWKVDDEATCLLMTEFYKNLLGKDMTKHEALEFAKQTVRSHKEKGWDNPEYWAAFILLDGLD